MEVGGANQFNSGRDVVTAMLAGRIELLVWAEFRFPSLLSHESAGVPPASSLRKGGRDARAPMESREGQSFTRKEDLCFTASYSHSPLGHPPPRCAHPPRRWRSGKPARPTPRAWVSMKSRIASAPTDVWSAR